jgi:hypothetical protein
MTRNAAFYFANLGADVSRCVSAVQQGNEARYQDSLARAYRTLDALRHTNCPEAYEEGLLLLYGLSLARESREALAHFEHLLASVVTPFALRLVNSSPTPQS